MRTHKNPKANYAYSLNAAKEADSRAQRKPGNWPPWDDTAICGVCGEMLRPGFWRRRHG